MILFLEYWQLHRKFITFDLKLIIRVTLGSGISTFSAIVCKCVWASNCVRVCVRVRQCVTTCAFTCLYIFNIKIKNKLTNTSIRVNFSTGGSRVFLCSRCLKGLFSACQWFPLVSASPSPQLSCSSRMPSLCCLHGCLDSFFSPPPSVLISNFPWGQRAC